MLKLPQDEPQQPRLPELDLQLAVRIFKDRFSIVSDPVPGKPHYVKFKSLMNESQTIQGMTHNKNTQISPLFLKQILERFDIPVPDFLEAIATYKKGPMASGAGKK